LTELYVRKLRPEADAFSAWDTHQRGLALRVQTSGQRSYKCVYSFRGRAQWLHLGDATAIGLTDARKMAATAMLEVATGRNPLAERRAERGSGTFAELHTRYVEEHAKKHNKSWKQAEFLVRRYATSHWGGMKAANITRGDVRAMMGRIDGPVLANQVLASVSAVFSWAVKQEVVSVNPSKSVDRNRMVSRERILSDNEILQFWSAFDGGGLMVSSALKVLLLTGQRPGEVAAMRREHIVDGWWELPGEPVAALQWPGTKNATTHRIWLPQAVKAIIADLDTTGFVFTSQRGNPLNGLAFAMRAICTKLKVERATPHDLRRTHGSTITRLGFGRDAMNRVQNHKEGGIASVYDRHGYSDENKRVMESVAAHIIGLAEGRATTANVVALR
jgi:integrase